MTVLDRESAELAAPGDGEPSSGRLRLDMAALVGAAMAVIGAGIGAQRLSDNSFLTHLASGREMLEHGLVRTDPFTWTSVGEPVVLQSWLASFLYGVVDEAAGLFGIRMLMALTAAALAHLCWQATEENPSVVTRAAVMAPVLFVGLRTWTERPLLLGLALFAIVVTRERADRPMMLGAVGAAWVNLHGSWPLGLVYLVARAFGARLDGGDGRDDAVAAAWLGGGMILGGVLNPYGPALLLFPLDLLDRRETLDLVAEWRSPVFDSGWTRAFLVLTVLVVVASARRVRWRLTVPALVFLAAALVSRRNIPVATIVFLPVLAHGLPAIGRSLGSRTSPAVKTATVAVTALVVVLPLMAIEAPHFEAERYPVAAVDHLDANDMGPDRLRIVHPDYVGNYLGLRYREPVAWIDDRYELHPRSLIDDYLVLLDGSDGWSDVLADQGADLLLWPADTALVELAEAVDGWRPTYADDDWVVLCRPGLSGC